MTSTAFSMQGTVCKVNISSTMTAIKNVYRFTRQGAPAAEIDVTNLESTAKEFILGLQDFGTLTLDLHPDYGDAGQNKLRTLRASGAAENFEIILPTAVDRKLTFAARVMQDSETGGVDAAYEGSFDLRITGAVTVADATP